MHLRILATGFFLLMVSLSGCSNKKEQTPFVSRSLQDVTRSHVRQATGKPVHPSAVPQTIHPASTSQTPPIGIVVDQNRIIIDTNQTRHFLESLTRKLDRNFKQIEQGLRKEKLQSPNETGIVITQDRIEVDLNQTQNFVNKWIRSMEAVGQQLDGIARELDKSLNP